MRRNAVGAGSDNKFGIILEKRADLIQSPGLSPSRAASVELFSIILDVLMSANDAGYRRGPL